VGGASGSTGVRFAGAATPRLGKSRRGNGQRGGAEETEKNLLTSVAGTNLVKHGTGQSNLRAVESHCGLESQRRTFACDSGSFWSSRASPTFWPETYALAA